MNAFIRTSIARRTICESLQRYREDWHAQGAASLSLHLGCAFISPRLGLFSSRHLWGMKQPCVGNDATPVGRFDCRLATPVGNEISVQAPLVCLPIQPAPTTYPGCSAADGKPGIPSGFCSICHLAMDFRSDCRSEMDSLACTVLNRSTDAFVALPEGTACLDGN